MSATDLPLITASDRVVEADGRPTRRLFLFLQGARERMGGADDKVDAAYQTAIAAVPQTTSLVPAGGLAGGGDFTAGDVGLALYKKISGLANLPTTGLADGDKAFATDGRKPGETAGNGTGVPATWTNGGWYSDFDGAVVVT